MTIEGELRTAVGVGCLLFAASCSRNDRADVDGPKFVNAGAFFSLLRFTRSNYIPLSKTELTENSVFIGTGSIVAVREGMSICSKVSRSPSCIRTLVMEVSVETTVKGFAPSDRIYVEYMHGGAFSAKTYDINKPRESVTLFLAEASWSPSELEELVGEGAGLPNGAGLHRLTTPQGLFVSSSGAVEQPLERGQSLFGPASTLKEIEEAAQRLEDVAEGESSLDPQGIGGSPEP